MSLGKRALLSLTVLTATFVTAEIAARVALRGDWSAGTVPRLRWADLGQREPERGWALRPSLVAEIVGPHDTYVVRTDERGYRQPRGRWAEAEAARRVLVLGDSIAFGWGVDQDETFAARLDGRLGEGTEVWNLACPGYSIDQSLWTYERHRRAVGPDVVVLVSVMNDVATASRSEQEGLGKPRLELVDGGWSRIEPSPDLVRYRPLPILHGLSGRLASAALLRRFREGPPPSPAVVPDRIPWTEKGGRAVDEVAAGVSAGLLDPASPIHEALRRLVASARADGARFVLVACPFGHDPFLLDPRFEPPPEGRGESRYSRALRELARSFDVEFVSMDEAFGAAVAAGATLHCGDGHPNARAHGLIADALVGLLAAR
ncbi:MAG: SGNH/GDSL hydrolase family protein [Planctomycetota bacterium]